MAVDSSKLYRARFPLSGLIAVVALGTIVFVLPRGESSAPGDTAEIQTGASTVTADRPATTGPSSPTTLATNTDDAGENGVDNDAENDGSMNDGVGSQQPPATPPALPEPVGGVRPEWPEWVVVSNEAPGSGKYSAELTLKGKSTDELMVWLSMQNWVLSAESEESSSWVLSAGGSDAPFSGVLEVLSPTTSRITLQR